MRDEELGSIERDVVLRSEVRDVVLRSVEFGMYRVPSGTERRLSEFLVAGETSRPRW